MEECGLKFQYLCMLGYCRHLYKYKPHVNLSTFVSNTAILEESEGVQIFCIIKVF
jgi:hypothetical protein